MKGQIGGQVRGLLSFIPMSNAMLDLINVSVAPKPLSNPNRYRFVDRTYTARKHIILLSACKDGTVHFAIKTKTRLVLVSCLVSSRLVPSSRAWCVYGHRTLVTTRYKCMQLSKIYPSCLNTILSFSVSPAGIFLPSFIIATSRAWLSPPTTSFLLLLIFYSFASFFFVFFSLFLCLFVNS